MQSKFLQTYNHDEKTMAYFYSNHSFFNVTTLLDKCKVNSMEKKTKIIKITDRVKI